MITRKQWHSYVTAVNTALKAKEKVYIKGNEVKMVKGNKIICAPIENPLGGKSNLVYQHPESCSNYQGPTHLYTSTEIRYEPKNLSEYIKARNAKVHEVSPVSPFSDFGKEGRGSWDVWLRQA